MNVFTKSSFLKISLFTFVILLNACASVRDDNAVWIDVRTVEEYNEDHIDGDLNIPLQVIDVEELATMFSKDEEINLYCRSGNRAGQAKQILEAAGFTNVNNRGGIGDARELRNLAAQSAAQ